MSPEQKLVGAGSPLIVDDDLLHETTGETYNVLICEDGTIFDEVKINGVSIMVTLNYTGQEWYLSTPLTGEKITAFKLVSGKVWAYKNID